MKKRSPALSDLQTKPDVMTYLSPQHFLDDHYKYRKSLDPHFSFQVWAQELGIKNRSFLRLIAIGQRTITASTLKILVNAFNFSDLEKEYFTNLVGQLNSRDSAERYAYTEALTKLLRQRYNTHVIEDTESFLQSAHLPLLQVLLSYEDLNRSPASLSHLLGIELKTIESHLKALQELKLAEKVVEPEGHIQWKSIPQSFEVPSAVGSPAAKHFHEQSLKKAIEALSLTPATRRYRSLLFPLDEKQFQQVFEQINDFAQALARQYDGRDFAERRLYQINFSVIPISGRAESTKEVEPL